MDGDAGLRGQDLAGLKDDAGRPLENILSQVSAHGPGRAAGEGRKAIDRAAALRDARCVLPPASYLQPAAGCCSLAGALLLSFRN